MALKIKHTVPYNYINIYFNCKCMPITLLYFTLLHCYLTHNIASQSMTLELMNGTTSLLSE